MYDETTLVSNEKEMQVRVMYWSAERNEVCIRHLHSFYIQHAKATDLLEHLHTAMTCHGLSLRNLFSLCSDGPNVNKKVFRLLNAELVELRNIGLIDIGTCNLHVVNNAFHAGLKEFGEQVADLAVAIKYFFKDRSSRAHDYEQCQKIKKVPKHKFIKHVTSRWLTLEQAAERLLEQWPAVLEYFLKFIPKEKSIEKTSTYKTIKNIITKPFIKEEIMFVIDSAKLFTNFSKTFQTNVPLIHVLYDELKYLFIQIIIRISKANIVELVEKDECHITDIFHIDNLIPLDNYEKIVGYTISSELRNDKQKSSEINLFAFNCRKHFKATAEYLLKKIPLFDDCNMLKLTRIIHPKYISQDPKDIITIAKKIPGFIEFSHLENEWRLLTLNRDKYFKDIDLDYNKNNRIDHFWRNVFDEKFSGELKFPYLKKVVTGILILSHGNSEVERGFSTSSKIVTDDRSWLKEKTLNSVLFILDSIKNLYNNKVENIQITPKLFKLAKNAHAEYQRYLEDQKKEKEMELLKHQQEEKEKKQKEQELEKEKAEKKRLEDLESELQRIRNLKSNKKKAALKILEEANEKLQAALKSNNLVDANIAHGLIEAANTILKEEAELEKQSSAILSSVNKRKSDLLNYFVKKSKNE